MKRNTLIILILLIAILATLMTGCKKKIEEKLTEKIIESTTGADVDISKDNTTIKTDQGTTQMGTNIKWPKDKMGDLKELKANITILSEDKNKTLTYIMFDGLNKADADKYLESIKDLGYKSIFETTSADGFLYVGNNENGFEINFTFSNDGVGSLTYAESQTVDVDEYQSVQSDTSLFTGDSFTGDSGTTENPTSTEEIDMTDDVPWPKDFFKGLPELEGKITGVSSSGEKEKYLYIEYVEKENAIDFINKIKNAGFIEGATEAISGDYMNYEASNSNGDYIVFSWNSGNYSSLSLVKGE